MKLTRYDPFDKRLWSRITKTETCWLYSGTIKFDGKVKRFHRVMYEIFKGAIPRGRYVMRSCGNPSCCNPDHLILRRNDNA